MPALHRSTLVPLIALALALLVLPAARAAAQVPDTASTANLKVPPAGSVALLTLVDNSKLQGRIIEVTATTIRFASAIGETTIPRSAVRRVQLVSESALHDGEVWPEDPSRTRLFFAPSGRTLREKESYFADAYIFFPSFQWGITNSFTLGAGASIIPGLGIDEQIFYLTPKVGIVSGPDLNVSVGALIAGAGFVSDNSPFGVGYGVATFGGEDRNVTVGAGFGYAGTTASGAAVLLLGGVSRVSKSIALVSENYVITGDGSGVLLSGGLRFIGERLSVDLAGWGSTESLVPIPYVAFIYKL